MLRNNHVATCACSGKTLTCRVRTSQRGRVRDRSHTALAYVYVGFFACFFHAISLERSCFRKIAFFSCFRSLEAAGITSARSIAHCTRVRMLTFPLVFTPYLWNAVVSGKSPLCFRSPEAAGIAHRPPRSLYCENKRRQTNRP